MAPRKMAASPMRCSFRHLLAAVYATSVGHRSAPPWEVARLGALGELHRPFDRVGKIVLYRLALEAAAQEVGPQEFAERDGLLGEAADAAEFPRQAAERVVAQFAD